MERGAQSIEHRAKSIRHNVLYFLVCCPLLIVLCSLPFVSYCYATTPEEEYQKIQKEIKTHKEKLEKVKSRERSILSDIEKANREISQVEAELRKYRKKFATTESKISQVEAEISLTRSNIEKRKEWIKRKLRAMQKYGHSGDMVMLLSSTDDISQLMRRWKYLHYLTTYEHEVLNTYEDNLKDLHEKEKQLMVLKAELKKNQEKVKQEEKALVEKKKEKEMLLASVRKEEASYARMLKELKESSKRILEIIRKETEQIDTYHAKGFSVLKGRLPWPVDGKVAIRYGSQKDHQFNTPIFRSGIFIKTDNDLITKAVHSGKVVFAEWFKGYGQLVIVNHGDGYHTLYGSLSEIFSKVGDIINIGQTIGRVGNSGILNVPGLYFEVRYKGKALDPLQWLKKR